MYNQGRDSYGPPPHEMQPYNYPPQSPTSPNYPIASPQYPPPEGSAYPPMRASSIDQQPQQAPGYSVPPQLAPAHVTHTSQTVVIQQPQQQIVTNNPQTWSTDICACFDDCGLCVLGCFCPCILPCVVSVKAGECCCVGSMCPVALRASIRERYNIQGDILSDWCVLNNCGLCALCQMARELDIRGKA